MAKEEKNILILEYIKLASKLSRFKGTEQDKVRTEKILKELNMTANEVLEKGKILIKL